MTPRTKAWFFLSFQIYFMHTQTHLCAAADSISSGQSLSFNQTLISTGGIFELGFFRPGTSPNYYLGIWYKKVSIQNKTYFWVANRNTPLTDPSSSELKLLEDGNLVLLNKAKATVWSTNTTSKSMNSSQAVLWDDGNFVLRNGVRPSDVFWQSFDHASDTWSSGGKIRYNNITKKPQLIISWKNSNDPSEGLFSLELDPIGRQYIIVWNRTRRYWSSGSWNGQIFSGVPEMRSNYIYSYNYSENVNESYFGYTFYNQSIISRSAMDLSGQMKAYIWNSDTGWFLFWSQPREQCEVYAFCGAFGVCDQNAMPFCKCVEGFEPQSPQNWDQADYAYRGCARKTPLKCGDKDGFSPMFNVRLPENPQALAVTDTDACRWACLNNCSCSAYTYNSGCSHWSGELLNLQQLSEGGSDLYIRLAVSDIKVSDVRSKKENTVIIAGVVAGITALLALVLLVIWRWRTRWLVGTSIEGSLVAFSYKDLQNATKNFSSKLGGGGFGSVFKGTLSDSTAIAVKKLEGLSQGEKQFRSEVSTIGTVQHVNLVRLRGFCSEGEKRLLVYDYMSNSSLNSNIFPKQDANMLSWNTRYQIALGTARGLTYLHEKCRDCIIHCDIKPENILLDADFCPKIADFGLAKLIGRDFSRVLTTMRGTRGYLAPEWISGVPITAKADVYSYGMMLIEIVSGRRNSEHSEEGNDIFFPTWVARKVAENEDVLAVLDNRLAGDANVEELIRLCRVACWCIQDHESNRPSMGQVVQILEGVMETNPPPVPRILQNLVESEESINFFSHTSPDSSQIISSTSSKSKGTDEGEKLLSTN